MSYKKNYIIFVGILGTAFEWLEYSYYGYLTTRISQLFFPNYDSRAGLLASMGIFAAGFIMRPIGGIIFGFIGDKIGRKPALFISILLMGCATFLMGALPTYATLDIYAPIILLICRLMQGLAVSGEFNGAAIFLIEHSKNIYPTLAGSWVGTASAIGMLLGACAAAIVSLPHMPEWAWRVPFFLAFISCLIANYLRFKMLESPLFMNMIRGQNISKFPLIEIAQKYKTAFINNLILAAFVSVYLYICNVYFVSYLAKDIHLPMSKATTLVALGEFFVVLCFPFAAKLSDRVGHKKIMSLGLVLATLATPLLFFFAKTGSNSLLALGQIGVGIANALVCAPTFHFIYKLFPTSIRYTGNATAWGLGAAIFGGSAPIVADYLVQYSVFGPPLYVIIFCALAMVVIHKNVFKEFELDSAEFKTGIMKIYE